MSGTVVWVHGDCLSPLNPALLANPDAPAVFVFDDAYLAEQRISLKRIMFMYECLLELPVVIRRGDVTREVLTFADERGAGRVVTSESASPHFAAICDAIRKAGSGAIRLDIVPVEPFVPYAGELDLRRFTRFWSAVRDLALRK